MVLDCTRASALRSKHFPTRSDTSSQIVALYFFPLVICFARKLRASSRHVLVQPTHVLYLYIKRSRGKPAC